VKRLRSRSEGRTRQWSSISYARLIFLVTPQDGHFKVRTTAPEMPPTGSPSSNFIGFRHRTQFGRSLGPSTRSPVFRLATTPPTKVPVGAVIPLSPGNLTWWQGNGCRRWSVQLGTFLQTSRVDTAGTGVVVDTESESAGKREDLQSSPEKP
jgi:hypothetical protein